MNGPSPNLLDDSGAINRENILDILLDGIDASVIITSADGRIVLWNRGAEEMFGWKTEEVLGRDVLEVTPSSMSRKEAEEILGELRSGRSWAGEFDLQRRDGTEFPAHVRNKPVLDPEGDLIGIVGISHDISKEVALRRELEKMGAELEEEVERKTRDLRLSERGLRKAHDRLSRLLGRLYEATEEERRRISRELHDEIGQRLTGLRLLIERAAENVTSEDLEQSVEEIDQISGVVRDLTRALHPSALESFGLFHALVEHIRRWKTKTGIEVIFDHTGFGDQDERIDRQIEMAAYRIVQEGLTNVAKHAETDNVTLCVWKLTGLLTIQIEDRGRGFALESAETNGLGLLGIEERAIAVGGKASIDSSPGEGTCVTVQFPLEEMNDDLVRDRR